MTAPCGPRDIRVIQGHAGCVTSINLGSYQVSGNYALDALGGMGLEASAVTYARDRNSQFFVGDEGLGVVEISTTGQTLGTIAFDWTGTGSSNNDAEGLTYLGGGQLVVVDERPQIAYQFGYSAGGTVALNNQPKVAITGSTASVGNVGTEGISVDPRDGRFYTVKQDNPAQLRVSTLKFRDGVRHGQHHHAVFRCDRPLRRQQPVRRADALADRRAGRPVGGQQPADPEPRLPSPA